jgi:hypothetical protein
LGQSWAEGPTNQQPFSPQKSTKETQKKKIYKLIIYPQERGSDSNSLVLLLCSFVAEIVSGCPPHNDFFDRVTKSFPASPPLPCPFPNEMNRPQKTIHIVPRRTICPPCALTSLLFSPEA